VGGPGGAPAPSWRSQRKPKGDGAVVEFRTSDTKRFFANRNNLLTLLKNPQHILLFLALFANWVAGG